MRRTKAGLRRSSEPPALGSDLDVDRARLCLFAERQPYRQDAVLELGADLGRVHRARQRERAAERAVVTLDPAVLLLLHAGGQLLVALQREGVVLDRYLNLVAGHVGKLRL